MAIPDFLVVGHVVKDQAPEGWHLGGTASYAAMQASRLGLNAAVVTSAVESDLADRPLPAEVRSLPSQATTVFRNEYSDGRRTQHLLSRAHDLSIDDVPVEWRRTEIVLLGPVCGEVPGELAHIFEGSLLGVSAQGWLRRVGPQGQVLPQPWRDVALWRVSRALFVSEEDLGGDESPLQEWVEHVPILCLTRADRGARVYFDDAWHSIPAFAEQEVDPTGAGDVFATAFLIRFHETNDVAEATRFAGAAASLSTAAEGIHAIPTRTQVEERLARSPEIVLQ
jgi:hypothetical protein